MIDPGATFPSTVIRDQDGIDFDTESLADGWALIYWYPKADTPGCTAQSTGLRDQIDVFDELGCTVVGVSLDAPEDNAAFRDRYALPFTLLSDAEGAWSFAVGALASAEDRYAQRIAYLLAPGGVVERAFVVEQPGEFAELVLDDLEDLVG